MDKINIRPARKQRLAEVIYGQILEQILAAKLNEGDKLPSEAELAVSCGVSRSVVREALMRLQADGLVNAKKGIGTFVSTRPSQRLTEFAEPAEISGYLRSLEPRIVLEAEAARLAAQRRTVPQLSAIREANEALRKAIEKGDVGREEDLAFHEAIAKAAGNEYFITLLKQIRRPVSQTVAIGLQLAQTRTLERRNRVIEEHAKIYSAIASEDAEGAATYMRYHLLQARTGLIDMHHLER
ncbi:FadR/GntR family transcriptional regulator [Pelagibacterium sediminicola]|uniref:FadR/GntR family transcriptional regulator n=1 Tax=Pelagibacterium sediminicola TaxID=2248761 RepID=UPI001FE8B8CA|nr:FadR/GntR family transcriptional regulator [Pelagibacterium sediminicola]